MSYHWDGQKLSPQYWQSMHGVNYMHKRMSSDLNLIKEEMGNKTTDEEVLTRWMTNVYNYNKKKYAFAQHSEGNTYCNIDDWNLYFTDVWEDI